MSRSVNSISIFFFIFFQTFVLCLSSAEESVEKQYKGYKVLRLTPYSTTQLQYLNELSTDASLVTPHKKIDFWTPPKDVNSSIDLMVSPDLYKNIRQKLLQQNIKNKVIIKDVGE